jgi:hypothetical protein
MPHAVLQNLQKPAGIRGCARAIPDRQLTQRMRLFPNWLRSLAATIFQATRAARASPFPADCLRRIRATRGSLGPDSGIRTRILLFPFHDRKLHVDLTWEPWTKTSFLQSDNMVMPQRSRNVMNGMNVADIRAPPCWLFTAILINKTSKRNHHLPKQKAEQQSLKDIQENRDTLPSNAP